MILRPLHKTDIPQLIHIEETSQVAPWSENIFKKCMEAGYSGWGVEIEGGLVGFTLVSLLAGECHILNLCILPRFQHQGLGKQLLEYTLDAVKKLDGMIAYLEVRRSNERAITLYKKMGFTQIGERKDYYPVPTGLEDALVFAKDLGIESKYE